MTAILHLIAQWLLIGVAGGVVLGIVAVVYAALVVARRADDDADELYHG
jgi:hypothetical protein